MKKRLKNIKKCIENLDFLKSLIKRISNKIKNESEENALSVKKTHN
jgi:hypothetical protein